MQYNVTYHRDDTEVWSVARGSRLCDYLAEEDMHYFVLCPQLHFRNVWEVLLQLHIRNFVKKCAP